MRYTKNLTEVRIYLRQAPRRYLPGVAEIAIDYGAPVLHGRPKRAVTSPLIAGLEAGQRLSGLAKAGQARRLRIKEKRGGALRAGNMGLVRIAKSEGHFMSARDLLQVDVLLIGVVRIRQFITVSTKRRSECGSAEPYPIRHVAAGRVVIVKVRSNGFVEGIPYRAGWARKIYRDSGPVVREHLIQDKSGAERASVVTCGINPMVLGMVGVKRKTAWRGVNPVI